MMIRRTFLALSVMALTVPAALAQDKMTLKIGSEGAYPPFNQLNSNNELEGFDIDIARALCEEMNAECEFVTQDWDGIIPALQAGKFDAIIASMSITPERQEQVTFSEPYYTNSLRLVTASDGDIKDATAETLSGKTIGVQQGTVAETYMTENMGDVSMKPYPTQEEAYLDMKNGRLDGVVADFGVQDEFVKQNEGFEVVGDPLLEDDEIAIAVRKDEQELADKFSAAIKAIRDDGTYQKINEKYFGFDIY
ncbi:transporter substrate-binding domain-containing protein [Notoacmeibacter sp. MSK16QG-6]|uniref:transporter substrate-binding domain-containing protein n=1 Tax=Notoacmeibacter sp. MSK16QG-6 TaxID=2957982 RepID=UPI0020A09CE9|nr:transporter substrate-binding domain-containing protein [Notoacmeibacter sp. MSK16QG-6]MCP1199485.1 transporter substrate-binding domain-containing protein [Notoacmeibacter sp. MSK16QG-6]